MKCPLCGAPECPNDGDWNDYEHRLVAAAPELLGALQSLLYQAQQMEGMFPDEDGTIDAAIKEAIEVINLAKGVTQ